MKQILFVYLLILPLTSGAQTSVEEDVKSKIVQFFDAFHKQDSVALRAIVSNRITMQSIGKDKEGKTQLSESDFGEFLKSIVAIPTTSTFEEKLLGFNIQVDGDMANAWTPYEFWYNGNFSHCGVNSFQLIKEDDSWKILYIVDTRRRDGCQ